MSEQENQREPDESLPTRSLIAKANDGDVAASEYLFQRLRPPLVAWAHKRLPPNARTRAETEDLVQNVLMGAVKNLRNFQSRGKGSLLGYLITGVQNRIRNEIAWHQNKPHHNPIDPDMPLVSREPSPLEQLTGDETSKRIAAALDKLPSEIQELIYARSELQMGWLAVATHVGLPSEDAARMAYKRATLALAKQLKTV